MSTPIANVTATYDGELVEVDSDVPRSSLASLLHSGDEIVIHEVLHGDQIDDLKDRYSGEWEEKVRFESDDDSESEAEEWDGNGPKPDIGTPGQCTTATCDAEAEVGVRVNTGQVRHYCQDCRTSADRLGYMAVDDAWSL